MKFGGIYYLQNFKPKIIEYGVLPASMSSLKFLPSVASYWIFGYGSVNQLRG